MIYKFLSLVRARLHRVQAVKLIVPMAVALSLILLAICFYYRAQGLRVNVNLMAGASLLTAMMYFLIAYFRKPSMADTAEFADNFFDLKDSLKSYLDFSNKKNLNAEELVFHKLQKEKTEELCNKLSVQNIAYPYAKGPLFSSVILIAIAAFLCTLEDSPEVQEKKLAAALNIETSEQNKKDLEKELEKLEKNMTEKEKEFYKSSKIKKMLKNMKATDSRVDALRQYSRLEKEISALSSSLAAREDKKLLKEISRQLNKNRSTSPMASALAKNDFKQASKNLKEQMKKLKDALNQAKKKGALDDARKSAQDMKNLADKMKIAAVNLSQNTSDMKMDISKLQKLSAKLCDNICKGGECDIGKAGECAGDMEKVCYNLCDKLDDMDAKKIFLAKLDDMKKSLSMCQSKINGQCSIAAASKKAGAGTSDVTNTQKTEIKPGYSTQLQGTKGDGPTSTHVEDAQFGAGISGIAKNQTRSIEYQRQMESFVEQENIPDSMKNGVKEYFKRIHQ